MSNLPIENHNFEKLKKELKEFSENLPDAPELDHVEEEGIFFDHKVTGEELNTLIINLQNAFIESTETSRKITKEFSKVYKTFESLDKDYIQGIKVSLESVKIVSNDALRASNEAREAVNYSLKSIENTEKNQKQIQNTVNALSTISQHFSKQLEQQQETLESQGIRIAQIENQLIILEEQLNQQVEVQKEKNEKIEKIFTSLGLVKEQSEAFNLNIAEIKQLNKRIIYAYVTAGIALVAAAISIWMK